MKQNKGTSGKWRVNEPHRSQKRQPRVGTNEQELLPTAGAPTNAQKPAVGPRTQKEDEGAPSVRQQGLHLHVNAFGNQGLPATGPKATNPLPKAGTFRPFTPAALAAALKAHADSFASTEPTGILTLEVLSSLASRTKGAVDVVQMAAAIRIANALLQSFGF